MRSFPGPSVVFDLAGYGVFTKGLSHGMLILPVCMTFTTGIELLLIPTCSSAAEKEAEEEEDEEDDDDDE